MRKVPETAMEGAWIENKVMSGCLFKNW